MLKLLSLLTLTIMLTSNNANAAWYIFIHGVATPCEGETHTFGNGVTRDCFEAVAVGDFDESGEELSLMEILLINQKDSDRILSAEAVEILGSYGIEALPQASEEELQHIFNKNCNTNPKAPGCRANDLESTGVER
jgi:hypothetical protein